MSLPNVGYGRLHKGLIHSGTSAFMQHRQNLRNPITLKLEHYWVVKGEQSASNLSSQLRLSEQWRTPLKVSMGHGVRANMTLKGQVPFSI